MATQITFYGQAAFKFVTPAGNVVIIDPWLTNPLNEKGKEDVAALKRADLILLTHGHADHVGDTMDIAKRTGARLVATHELSEAMKAVYGYPAEKAGIETTGHIGGELSLLGGDVTITFVPAYHGSGLMKEGAAPYYGGMPAGFVVAISNGPTIYHTGDTDLFSDMALISRYNQIDLMLVCIGDHFTMGPRRAADAVQLINPGMVIPMHYSTFPVLTGTPEVFESELKKRESKAGFRVMKVGETIEL